MNRLLALLLALLVALAPVPAQLAELNNSGTGQWSESDSANTSPSPDGFPAGMSGANLRDSGRAVMGALKRFWDRINPTVTTTGAANAYVYTPTNISFPTAYVTGECVAWKASFANTAAATFNWNTLGPKNLFKPTIAGPAALTGGEIQANQLVTSCYDGTQLLITSALSGAQGVTILPGGKATAVTAPVNTSENILQTITLPANALGANGIIKFHFTIVCTNNVNAKTLRIRHSGIGGTIVGTIDLASTTNSITDGSAANQNATNSQVWDATLVYAGPTWTFLASASAAAIDTTAATTIVMTIQKGTAGDSVVLKKSLWLLASDGQ